LNISLNFGDGSGEKYFNSKKQNWNANQKNFCNAIYSLTFDTWHLTLDTWHLTAMIEEMDEWINEDINEWRNRLIKKLINEWMNEWINK